METFAVMSIFFAVISFARWFTCQSFALYAFLMIVCMFITLVLADAEQYEEPVKKPVKRTGMRATEAAKLAAQMKFEVRK